MTEQNHLSEREIGRVSRVLRSEFVSGIVVIVAAVAGFAAANSPLANAYAGLRDLRIGPAAIHLDLSVGDWAADGLLAIFFFVVGLELKREFTGGALSRPATAIVPVAAAVGGVAVPALIYLAWNTGTDAAAGWAIPTATDIAFAVTVLGLVAPRIPPVLRLFLLTLAVVDDLIAILIIAVFYTAGLRVMPLMLAVACLAVYWLLSNRFAGWFARNRPAAWLVLLPIGVCTWALVHESGLHATIAGVLLAFAIPVRARAGNGARRRTAHEAAAEATIDSGTRGGATNDADASPAAAPDSDSRIDLAGVFAHRFGPLSGLIAVPIFAFFAAGVTVGGESRFPADPVALGIMMGLVIGKPVGIALTAWALTRFTRASLGAPVLASELIGVAALGGIGFTVSLLIADLSFVDPAESDTARLAVMAGSVIAAIVAAVILGVAARRRGRSAPVRATRGA